MDTIALVFVSKTQLFDTLYEQLNDYQIIAFDSVGNYMNTLIQSQVAMIMIDGQHPEWERFTTTPKISPATRRIPIFLITSDKDQSAEAHIVGADFTLPLDDLLKNIARLIKDKGRIPDPEMLEQLACDCEEELPPLAVEGVKKFNAGEYYPQHDLFEEQWVNTSSPVRDLYRAVLQVGVAYYQIERGNYRGAVKMLQRSVQWLGILPDVCQTIDVEQLRKDSYAVRAELERLGEDRLDEFDTSLLKPVVMVSE